MRYVGLVLIMILFCNQLSGQQEICDSIFQKTILQEKTESFEKYEKIFFDILRECPDYYDVHTKIINHYETYYTAVPILVLIWQNMIDYKSEDSKSNIAKMNHLYHRYLVVSRKGTDVHVPPKFVKDWYLDYENNMSPLEAGFIMTGAVDFSKEHKKLNSAERMIAKFDILFVKIDELRSRYHGFYWDLYVDFLSSLYKTEHFKTAMYVIMYGTNEKEIRSWINNNPDKIDDFYRWRQEYITEFVENNPLRVAS